MRPKGVDTQMKALKEFILMVFVMAEESLFSWIWHLKKLER